MKNILILILIFMLGKSISACDNKYNDFHKWLGKNSELSKTFTNAKCAMDSVLNNVPLKEKITIINLIKQSYKTEINKRSPNNHYGY